jgi:hypothetical protein
MRAKRLFIASGLFLVVALVTVGSKWNGSAGVTAGWPPSTWAINFCGSANGWAVIICLLCLLATLFLFLAAIVTRATGDTIV